LGGYSKLLHLGAASLLLDDLPASTGKKLPRYPIVPADMDDGRVVFLRRVTPVTDAIDTGTPSGRFFFHVMASLAEMERELIVERTRAGLDVARQLGRKGGRKPKMTDSKIESAKKLLASGVPPKDVAKNLGVSIPTLYRWVPASAQA
jgi:tRNA A58 N-methylase Trm61